MIDVQTKKVYEPRKCGRVTDGEKGRDYRATPAYRVLFRTLLLGTAEVRALKVSLLFCASAKVRKVVTKSYVMGVRILLRGYS